MNRACLGPEICFVFHRRDYLTRPAPAATSNLAPIFALDERPYWYNSDIVMNDLLILASLLDGPQHGYALKKRIGTITGHGPMHNNLVYPLLKRFVAASWVSRRKAQGQRGQTRELYSLTPKGKQVLLSRLADFSEKDAVSGDACRLRVGLFAVLSLEARAKILDSREQWLAKRIGILAAIARTMTLDTANHRIYTVSAEFGPPPAPTPKDSHPWPEMKPGTFTLMIYER